MRMIYEPRSNMVILQVQTNYSERSKAFYYYEFLSFVAKISSGPNVFERNGEIRDSGMLFIFPKTEFDISSGNFKINRW